jgi:septal ring factor EnvC (AmiA/AmiB activator)
VPPNSALAFGAICRAVVVALAALLVPSAWAGDSSPEKLVADLDATRQDGIAAAREMQQRQAKIAALDRELPLLSHDAAARQRGLDESQVEQAQLLGALEQLARHPPEQAQAFAGAPIDRVRSGILLAATLPALQAEAKALAREIAAVAALRARIAAGHTELAATRDALAHDRERLAEIAVHRADLNRQLLPDSGKAASQPAKPIAPGSDLGDLIERAELAVERREKTLLARIRAGLPKEKADALTLATADPIRPQGLRPFDAAAGAVLLPVAETLRDDLGKAENRKPAGPGLTVASLPGAVVVAPFDGKIVYAGPAPPYELVLIIRHTDGYHSLIAGLGRADSAVGHWVLAGEPVGMMPDAAEPSSGGTLYFELRRDGRPVDPQPWLAKRDETIERGDEAGKPEAGDQRVRE